MAEIFLTVLNMSLTAGYVILIVMIVRFLLKKAPKFISYAMWSIVAFRLVIPFSFESSLSLMPRNADVFQIQSGVKNYVSFDISNLILLYGLHLY